MNSEDTDYQYNTDASQYYEIPEEDPEGSANGLANTDDEESFDQFLKRKKKSTLVRVGTRV